MLDKTLQDDVAANRGEWPEHVPDELALRLRDALDYASCSQADIWDEVKEWLEDIGVVAPGKLACLRAGAGFRSDCSIERRVPD